MTALLLVSMQYLNVPYLWGGDKPLEGLDCSGLVYNVLKDLRVYHGPRLSSQGFFSWAINNKGFYGANPCHGCLLFFGASIHSIRHVAVAVDEQFMIEAGGGDRTTTNILEAQKRNARVRVAPISRRSDLIASVKFFHE